MTNYERERQAKREALEAVRELLAEVCGYSVDDASALGEFRERLAGMMSHYED